MTQYREILRLHSLGLSNREIATSLNVSRNTVSMVLIKTGELHLFWPLESTITDSVIEQKLYPKKEKSNDRQALDFDYIQQELKRPGVTKKLLWKEYCDHCSQTGQQPLMYSQFCAHVQEDEMKRHASMHIPRKPGEQIEVDWAGDPAHWIDPITGEEVPAPVFVGVMTYSQYAFAEAFKNEKQLAWISAHQHMYDYFGGVARVLVSDNCTTAVIHTNDNWFTPELNKTYHEMAEHYGCAIVPARVRKPKDKPNAEGSVNIVGMWIIAALRNEKFFSLRELNTAIQAKLVEYNNAEFQKKEGSRQSLFSEEKPLLLPLPATRFELADWKVATVQYNYHIAVNNMYYSVPYNYIHKKVNVRITENTIEVFLEGNRIAFHKKLTGRPGQYSTQTEHMPEKHQDYLDWNGDRFRRWAKSFGPNTEIVIDKILTSGPVEQQFYRSCMGVVDLAKKYTGQLLETACSKVVQYNLKPSYKTVKNLLLTLQDEEKPSLQTPTQGVQERGASYGIVRGANYYGGKNNVESGNN